MAITFYEGAAGTGKTRRIFEDLEGRVSAEPLMPPQRVLVFSRMHGARRKLLRELKASAVVAGQFECGTIDAFAWRLARRWRHLLRTSAETLHLPASDTYSLISAQAARLLSRPEVEAWFGLSYRFVVLDEGQDCRDGQLELVQTIAKLTDLVVAADEFQDLASTTGNPCVAWLRAETISVPLSTCHRTTRPGLLAGAHALRAGITPTNGSGLTFKFIPAPNPAAFYAASMMSSKSLTILYPTGPQKSKFVRDLLARLQGKPMKLKKQNVEVGPFTLARERAPEEEVDEIVAAVSLSGVPTANVSIGSLTGPGSAPGLVAWGERQRRLRGVTTVTEGEIRTAVEQMVHERRARGHLPQARYRVMTIHQAKNQQFDRVLILWPYEIPTDPEQQRRLLYNAITRARIEATVILQGDDKSDLLAKMCASTSSPPAVAS